MPRKDAPLLVELLKYDPLFEPLDDDVSLLVEPHDDDSLVVEPRDDDDSLLVELLYDGPLLGLSHKQQLVSKNPRDSMG